MENIRRLVKAALEPDDINVLWVDVSNPQNFVFRLYRNGRWDTAATQAINDPRIFGIDTVPALNSPNVITSGGVYTAIHSIESTQVQSDWNQTDTTAKDYIKNKPTTFGEITSILMNGSSVPVVGGVADLGTVITSLEGYVTAEDYDYNSTLDDIPSSGSGSFSGNSSAVAKILKVGNQQIFPATDKDLVQRLSGELDKKYEKPDEGIPATDLDAAIQASLELANSAYQKPVGGIPAADLADGVIPGGGSPNAVTYTEQTLTAEQKAQARTNIGAGTSNFSGSYTDLSNKPTIPDELSDLTEDSTHRTVTDTEKSTWNSKSNFSGSYTDLTNKPTIPAALSDLSDDSTHRLVTDAEKTTWNAKSNFSGSYNDLTDKPTIPDISGKQDTLVSGTNIKTINNESLLGSGNITLSGGSSVAVVDSLDSESATSALSAKQGKVLKGLIDGITVPTALSDLSDDSTHRVVTDTEKSDWSGKQEALVSGTNIKTINNESLLGSGNITISAGSSTPIEDNLTSTSTTSALSANQGYVLKGLLDNKVSQVSGKDLSDENYTASEKSKLAGIANGAEVNVQANWNEDDSSSDAYILNKPTIPSKTSDLTNDSNFVVDASYVHTANNFTTTLKNKLNGIEAGAEVNVNADWNASSGDAQILNKPTIPSKTSDLTNDSGFLTSHQDISGKENISNKVTSLSSSSTDTQYPSAKCVYDYVTVLEAPTDGNQYIRKNGAWSQLDTTALVNATVNITLTTDSGLNASNLAGTGNNDGAVITIKNASDNSTITTLVWSGTTVTTYITGGITFKISCGAYSGFIAPSDATYTALSGTTINAICTYKDNTPGVYIRYTDGSMSNYDTLISGKTPVGVALVTSNQRIVINTTTTNIPFGDNTSAILGNSTSTPQSDFSGSENTDAIITSLGTTSSLGTYYAAYWAKNLSYADGSTGYLPAAGQLYEIKSNHNAINGGFHTLTNSSFITTNIPILSSTETVVSNSNYVCTIYSTTGVSGGVYISNAKTYDSTEGSLVEFTAISVADF